MAIIDPEGLFGGDRIAKLSDPAKLYWPWLFLAANGFARFEVNYRRIVQRVFTSFATPPSEEQFWALIHEYQEAYLLFLYTSESGQIWGQWETSPRNLPDYKTAADKRSPAPPAEAVNNWR